MSLTISTERADLGKLDIPLLAVALAPGARVSGALTALDKSLGGSLKRALDERDFRGARDETLALSGGTSGIRRLLLVGVGAADDRAHALRRAAAVAARHAHRLGVGRMAWYAEGLDAHGVEKSVIGLSIGAWEFRDLRTVPPPEERREPLREAVILADDPKAVKPGVAAGEAVAEGYALARHLGNLPGNVCTPDHFEETARGIAGRHGMKVTVLGRAEMEREGMGAFLAVAQATPQEPRLIVLEHRAGGRKEAPLALIGKGLCFDSGGVSIKPAQGMEWMKFDMSGAGAVLGAMEAIGRLKLERNVVGIIGCTTNMISGTAIKPGDIVKASNGKFIEIINTDAEGRLVLADLLHYAARFGPRAMIDAATLTGACVVALGNTTMGVFGDEPPWTEAVLAATRRAGEPGWALPMSSDYRELIKSDFADIKNSGGRAAGAISAAMFLKEFVSGCPWVHLDIAGTAYSETDLPTMPKGSTGIPVGTFVELARERPG